MKTRTLFLAACCTACILLLPGPAVADEAAAHEPAASAAPAPAVEAPSPAAAPAPGSPAPLGDFLLGSSGDVAGGDCSPAGADGPEGAVARSCVDCDSPENSCTPGGASCHNYCLNLVGEIGMCSWECNCCVCPEPPPPADPPQDPTQCTNVVCRCDGGDHPPEHEALCGNGCYVISCS